MPLVDNRGRLFGKANLFDLLIVLILVAVLAFLGIKYLSPASETVFAQDCLVTLAWSFVEPGVAQWVRVGDKATDGGGNTILEVAEATVRPTQTTVNTADGRVLIVDQPRAKTVIMKVHMPRVAQTGNFEFKGQEMKLGINIVVTMDQPVLGSVYKFSAAIQGIEFSPPKGDYPPPLETTP